MRKTVTTLLVGACLWAASHADAPAPGGTFLQVADGTLVKEADDRTVYLVDRGVLRPITGGAFGKLYPDFRGVAIVIAIPRHLVQETLGEGTRLVRPKGDPTVWLIDNGRTKRHVADPQSFRRRGFAWSKVEVVSREDVDYLTVGPRLG